MRKLIPLLSICSVIWSGAVYAGPPERVTFGPIVDSYTAAECEGFDIILEYTYYGEMLIFYDSAGNPDRIFYNQRYPYVMYNSEDPSKRFSSTPAAGDERWLHYKDGEMTVAFGSFHDLAKIPGMGNVWRGIGRVVWNLVPPYETIFEVKKQFVADFATMCSYLAA